MYFSSYTQVVVKEYVEARLTNCLIRDLPFPLPEEMDVEYSTYLRGMLVHLQPAEEVLMLGWGDPMPILVKSRRYDDQFWQDLLGSSGAKNPTSN